MKKKLLKICSLLLTSVLFLSITAGAFELGDYDENKFNMASALKADESAEFAFSDINDSVIYRLDLPSAHSDIVYEVGTSDGSRSKLNIGLYQLSVINDGSYIYNYTGKSGGTATLPNRNYAVSKGGDCKAYIEITPTDESIGKTFYLRYKLITHRGYTGESVKEISPDEGISFNFSSLSDDKWYKVILDKNSDSIVYNFKAPYSNNGTYLIGLYTAEDIAQTPDADELFLSGITANGSVTYKSSSRSGTYYLHLYPADASVLNTDFSFCVSDVSKEVPEINANLNVIQTEYGTVSAWAKNDMDAAYKDGMLPETMVGFDFTKTVNRSEFAAIAIQVYNALTNANMPLPNYCPFNDISGDINEKSIKQAFNLTITNGVSDVSYAPKSNLTREQLATMLCRVIKKHKFEGWTLDTDDEYYLNTDGVKLFDDDSEISPWARPSIYYMVLHNIINGMGDNRFVPRGDVSLGEAQSAGIATREQAVIIAHRMYLKRDTFGDN